LVDGSVSSDHDQEVRPVVNRLDSKLPKLARAGRDERRTGEADVGRAPLDRRPAPSRGTVGGSGIDQKDNALRPLRVRSARQCAAVAVSRAIRVMRSTAARSSSSLMRVNSPSISVSLTVRMPPACTLRKAPSVNSAAASISTPSRPRADQRSYWLGSGL